MRRTLPLLLVLSLAVASGCDVATTVNKYPWLGPIAGGQPKPSPFTLNTGSVRGFVFGAEGKSQPIPLAFVTTGSISSFAGNPIEPGLASNQEEDDEELVYVMHDFGDGAGEVLTERRLRKKPAGPVDGDDGDFRNKYVYLRPGEFFLEDVPEGVVTLKASYGNVVSQQNPVTVYGGFTLADVLMNVPLPRRVAPPDDQPDLILRPVEWTSVQPKNGITVSVQIQDTTSDSGQSKRDVLITYKPDPPDVAFELKAPPGSAGTTIRALDVVYTWTTTNNPKGDFLGPIRIPIAPAVISPAQETAFGPPTIVTVPVGSSVLTAIFAGGRAPGEAVEAGDIPGLVVANIEFIDEDGTAVKGKNFLPLQVSTVLRQL